jgi:hypothetical protein
MVFSNGIYVVIYHGIYHRVYTTSTLFIHLPLQCIHVSSTPCAVLFLLPLQCLNCSLQRFGQTLPMPLHSFYHSDLARLPQPIAPHPEVELIEPASIASPLDSRCWNLQ